LYASCTVAQVPGLTLAESGYSVASLSQ
jgi:hypothetical protein